MLSKVKSKDVRDELLADRPKSHWTNHRLVTFYDIQEKKQLIHSFYVLDEHDKLYYSLKKYVTTMSFIKILTPGGWMNNLL